MRFAEKNKFLYIKLFLSLSLWLFFVLIPSDAYGLEAAGVQGRCIFDAPDGYHPAGTCIENPLTWVRDPAYLWVADDCSELACEETGTLVTYCLYFYNNPVGVFDHETWYECAYVHIFEEEPCPVVSCACVPDACDNRDLADYATDDCCIGNCLGERCGTTCVPDNCAATTCSTSTCNNGCAVVPGELDPGCGLSGNYCSSSGYDNGCYYCAGTKDCDSASYCEVSNYTCSGGVLDITSDWWSDTCFLDTSDYCGYYAWLLDNDCMPINSEDCGTDTCLNPLELREECIDGDVWEYSWGKDDACHATASPLAGSCDTNDYHRCSVAYEKEPCPVGYVCTMVGVNDAECVAKSAIWTEI